MNARERIELVPWWKRLLICRVLRRRAWKVARAYNVVGCDLLNGQATWEHGDDIRKLGERKWAELYGLPLGDVPERLVWQPRAESAERDLDWERRRREQLERQIELLKNTVRGLKDLKRQRKLP